MTGAKTCQKGWARGPGNETDAGSPTALVSLVYVLAIRVCICNFSLSGISLTKLRRMKRPRAILTCRRERQVPSKLAGEVEGLQLPFRDHRV